MSPSWAARTAVVCILVSQVAIAHAQPKERRPIAVIDLSDSPEGEKVAKELGAALNNHEELRPIDDAQSQAELIGPVVDEDAKRISDERAKKGPAEDALRRGDFPRAASIAEAAMANLAAFGSPVPAVVKLYAELAFIHGTARLGNREPKLAADAFRLVRALQPEFRPDPDFTFFEVIEAFDKAVAVPVTTGTIAVNGRGRIYIDGKHLEKDAPTWIPDVPAGLHVVWLVGPEREPRGKQLNLPAGQKHELAIEDAPASPARLVARARVMLRQASPPFASDPAARGAAIAQLARKVNVRDAILVTSVNGKIVIQTWRDRAPGFSAHRELKNEKPEVLLEPLAPPKKVVPKPDPRPDPKLVKIPVVVEKAWWEKPRYWVGGSALTVALVFVGVVAYQSWDRRIDVAGAGFLTR